MHGLVVVAPQAPEPLQLAADVATPAAQPGPAHSVVAPGNVHAARLVPSHAPAQTPVPVHAVRDPTGAPVAGEQVPSRPGTLHASHWPSQAVSQHTPSTHWPDVHSSVVAHIPPLGRRPRHDPSMHALPDEHCALLVHAVRQALSPHP